MDLAGLRPLFHRSVVVTIAAGTRFIGRLEPLPDSSSTVSLVPLDATTAANNDYAINGVAALDIGSIVFVQPLAG